MAFTKQTITSLGLTLILGACASGQIRNPAGSLSTLSDQRECIQKLSANWPSKAGGLNAGFVEVPSVGLDTPQGLYLISQNEAYFIPTSSGTYIKAPFKNETRVLEIQLNHSPLDNAMVPSIVRSCDYKDKNCSLNRQSPQEKAFDDIVVGNQQARNAMNRYIEKMLPGAVERYTLEEKENIVLSAQSDGERQMRLQSLSVGVAQGLEACLRAIPQMEAAVKNEQNALVAQEAADESITRNLATESATGH